MTLLFCNAASSPVSTPQKRLGLNASDPGLQKFFAIKLGLLLPVVLMLAWLCGSLVLTELRDYRAWTRGEPVTGTIAAARHQGVSGGRSAGVELRLMVEFTHGGQLRQLERVRSIPANDIRLQALPKLGQPVALRYRADLDQARPADEIQLKWGPLLPSLMLLALPVWMVRLVRQLWRGKAVARRPA